MPTKAHERLSDQTNAPRDEARAALGTALDATSKADLLTVAHGVLGGVVRDYEKLGVRQRRAAVEAAAAFLQDLRAAGVIR